VNIKAANIVEGAEHLEKDTLVGVFYVGNGKVAVIPAEEPKSVQISRIGDVRNGSAADGDRFSRAIGFGNKTPKWPIIAMYHQDDLNGAAQLGSSDLLYDAALRGILVPVNAPTGWIVPFDHDNNGSTSSITRGIVVLDKSDVQTDLEQGSLSVSFSFIANDDPITLILPNGKWASEDILQADGVVTITGTNADGPIDIVEYDTDPGFTLVRDSDDTITITPVNLAPAQITISFTADAFDAEAGYVSGVVVSAA
jgi:hypothetical protein